MNNGHGLLIHALGPLVLTGPAFVAFWAAGGNRSQWRHRTHTWDTFLTLGDTPYFAGHTYHFGVHTHHFAGHTHHFGDTPTTFATRPPLW